MKTIETNVSPDSEYYIADSNALSREIFYYPISAGIYHYLPGYSLHRLSYDSCLIMYVIDGCVNIATDSGSYTAYADQFIAINCYREHSYTMPEDTHVLWLHFDGNNSVILINYIINNFGTIISLTDSSTSLQLMNSIYNSLIDNTIVPISTMSRYIYDLLMELISHNKSYTTPSYPDNISDSITYINEHFNEDISLDTLAKKAALSTFYFLRIFKKATGYTPHEYIVKIRIEHAKFLLKNTHNSIKQICFSTGFTQESGFCTSFKKFTGYTPLEYRNSSII